MKEVPWG